MDQAKEQLILDMRFHEMFGHLPTRFCEEVKTILYNEFLAAAELIKEKLVKVDDSKSEEVHIQLSCYLSELSNKLDSIIEKLQEYFYKNYVPDPTIPLHEEGTGIPLHKEEVTECEGAAERLDQLRKKLQATDKLNKLLLERINSMKKQTVERREILKKLKEQKSALKNLQKAKETVQQMRAQCRVLTET